MADSRLERIFLNERFMAVVCILMTAAGLASLVFCLTEQDTFETFMLFIKLITAIAMFFSFRFFKWDAAKGLMGGVLFCLMAQEAHLVFSKLWVEENFDVYLTAGVQGSLFLAGAGMTLFMTMLITLNHFFINYSAYGNPKNVILNRMALAFKLAVSLLLVIANSKLHFSAHLQWSRFLQYMTDIALLLLLTCMEAQFDSFNALRKELRREKQERRAEK